MRSKSGENNANHRTDSRKGILRAILPMMLLMGVLAIGLLAYTSEQAKLTAREKVAIAEVISFKQEHIIDWHRDRLTDTGQKVWE